MTNERKELFTEKVVAGRRTYFFDVKETKDGAKYLVISERDSANPDGGNNRVMVFEDHLQNFYQGMKSALGFLGIEKNPAQRLEELKHKYPKAYEKWTPEDDKQLRAKSSAGESISALATLFQRQESAIRSRLAKLGSLLPKTG